MTSTVTQAPTTIAAARTGSGKVGKRPPLSSLQNCDYQTPRLNGVVQVTGVPARDIDVTMLALVRRDSFSNKDSSSRSNGIISTPSPLTCSNGDGFLEDLQVTRLNSPVRDDERSRSDDESDDEYSEVENRRPQLHPDDNCNATVQFLIRTLIITAAASAVMTLD